MEATTPHAEVSFLPVGLLLLCLNPCLDNVGVSDFATVLQLLADIEKSCCFGGGALRGCVLAFGDDQPVVGLGHRDHEAACGDFGLGPCLRESGRGAAIITKIRKRNRLMSVPLADVF